MSKALRETLKLQIPERDFKCHFQTCINNHSKDQIEALHQSYHSLPIHPLSSDLYLSAGPAICYMQARQHVCLVTVAHVLLGTQRRWFIEPLRAPLTFHLMDDDIRGPEWISFCSINSSVSCLVLNFLRRLSLESHLFFFYSLFFCVSFSPVLPCRTAAASCKIDVVFIGN